ncbi:Gcr2p KNAG_0F01110 [Huiozyma naganishii CBS 8797]|uniref:Uncharacterized protein n=1 Tax=Huiozyma naganishii (strain ATCC MYA-139 / BCRC 22969 / CBS 8797 / KCTC 17520 / NBRC 10181 / NCYC 3082 / Yp74L-3) TaxID=1071383 RepID=J7S753_HUIN7|nr:hypothetical protein KNAG_0F01110 [Kazachstania naganishii CBS 8797]CCK70779.1 hypothetical protein KNAG_0F01110 [Kazachstania naganishii CBS 8797]
MTRAIDAVNTPSPFAVLHHETKLDVYIIRGYCLLSSETIINSGLFQNIINSPQTAQASPPTLTIDPPTNTITKNTYDDNNNTLTTTAIQQDGTINSSIDSNNTTTHNPASSLFASQSNNAATTQNGSNWNAPLFNKLSLLYTALITSGSSIGEKSTVPKSAIELYHRFAQIMRELDISCSLSPYSKYFHKLDGKLWQIKSDTELADDQLWQMVTSSIFAIYDAQMGKMINIPNGKTLQEFNGNLSGYNRGVVSSSNTPNDNSSVLTNQTPSATGIDSKLNNPASNTPNSSVPSVAPPVTTPAPTSKKPKKKYTRKKPTATGSNKSGGVRKGTTKNAKAAKESNVPKQGDQLKTSISFPELLNEKLQNLPVDEDGTTVAYDSGNLDMNKAMSGYYGHAPSPTSGTAIDSGIHSNIGFNMMPSSGYMGMGSAPDQALWKRRSLGSIDINTLEDEAVEEILRMTNEQNNQTQARISQAATAAAAAAVASTTASTILGAQQILRSQVQESCEMLVKEKDRRISQLEQELELESRETSWLRKLLIEDMGCIKSMMTDIKR